MILSSDGAEEVTGEHFSLSVLVRTMFVGTAAMLALGVQPVLLGAVVREGRLSAAELGPVAAIEIFGLALGSALGPRFLLSGGIRGKALVLAIFLTMCDLATALARSTSAFIALRSCAGLAEGLLLGVTNLVLIRSNMPDRLNVLFIGVSTVPQALLAYPIFPLLVMPLAGANGGFYCLAAFCLAAALVTPFLIDRVSPVPPRADERPTFNWRIPVSVLAIVLEAAAIGGSWDYQQVLGQNLGISNETIGFAIGGNLLFQLLGALLSAIYCRRVPFRLALVTGTTLQMIVIVCMAVNDTLFGYLAASFVFGGLWLAILPFQVRLLIEVDPSRNLALFLVAINLVGLGAGPMLGALGVRGHDVSGVFWINAVIMTAAVVLFALASSPTRAPARALSNI